MQKILLILLSIIISTQAICSETPTLDQITQIVKSNGPTDVDSLLEKLPEDIRKEYVIVYRSKSLQSASIKYPRVILISPEKQFYLSFSHHDNPNSPAANSEVEMIESYGPDKTTFARISFKDRVAKIERNPSICMGCHKGQPIFDGYPNWPGFYGSGHNGRYYGESTGTSHLPRFEFEEAGLKSFKSNAKNEKNYRHLLNLESVSISSLSILNKNVNAVIASRTHQIQNEKIYTAARSLDELNDFLMMSVYFNYWSGNNTTAPYPELQTETRFKEYNQFVAENKEAYGELSKKMAFIQRARIQADIEDYGTTQDKILGNELGVVAFRRIQFPGRTDLGTTSPNNVIYNESFDLHLYSSLFIQYLVKNNIIKDIKYNNSLVSIDPLRFVTGVTGLYLFEGHAMFDMQNNKNMLRSSRDLKEFSKWIISPIKKYKSEDLQKYPYIVQILNYLQSNYIAAIKDLPSVDSDTLEEVINYPGWLPEHRQELKKIRAQEVPQNTN